MRSLITKDGDGYRQLRDWNPTTDLHDHAALLALGCTINGLQCLPEASIEVGEDGDSHVYRFRVTFADEVGRPLVVPQDDGVERSTLDYTVVRMAIGFFVQELPVYRP